MWSPARHRFTLRQTVSTMEKADSMTFVLARVRRNCAGTQVYALRYREEWLNKIPHAGVRRRAELLYQQLDALQGLRRTLRPELLAESRKHKPVKLLRQIPCIGPIRAARLMALMQTPHRFRSKRQLWTYSGLGIETHERSEEHTSELQSLAYLVCR